MGAVLDDENGVANLCGRDYWIVELKNKKILLRQIEAAIFAFTSADGANGIQSYTIDTGQDKQSVTRENLGSLYATQKDLTAQIALLEAKLFSAGPRRISPRF